MTGPTSFYDVIVLGGGSAGCAAAIAAAGHGVRTLLVERHSFLGGASTAVLDSFYGAYAAGKPFKVVGGLFDRVTEQLEAAGESMIRPNRHGGGIGIAYNADFLKVVWEKMAMAAGVQLLCGALFIEAAIEKEGYVITVASKGRLQKLASTIVIDATGDADFCAGVNAGYDAPGAGAVQTMTTVMRVAGVDGARFEAIPKAQLKKLVAEAVAGGTYAVPHDTAVFLPTIVDGVYIALATRVSGYDPFDPFSMTAAEVEGRRQALEFLRLFTTHVAGFENARLLSLAPQIGVRESRRIDGDYRLTEDDVLSARKFPDVVAQSGSPIEEQHSSGVRWCHIPEDGVYDIPYRSLLPRGLPNVIVAGRCLSASHLAHASCRLMAQCIAMGQAAGTAAAMAIGSGGSPRAVDMAALQGALVAKGAILFDRQHVEFSQ